VSQPLSETFLVEFPPHQVLHLGYIYMDHRSIPKFLEECLPQGKYLNLSFNAQYYQLQL
jgi:hypothetical protein